VILGDDPPAYRERSGRLTEKEIQAFNQRSSQNESLVERSLFTAGMTWAGVLLWDDIRTLDYARHQRTPGSVFALDGI
jgi:hypothetical protein